MKFSFEVISRCIYLLAELIDGNKNCDGHGGLQGWWNKTESGKCKRSKQCFASSLKQFLKKEIKYSTKFAITWTILNYMVNTTSF